MKTRQANREIRTNTDVKTAFREVKFIQSAEAFELYSQKLYAKPKLAVLRELTSNGADSQCRRGEGYDRVPVRVQLPTPEDPNLYIRDYGTSMTFEQVTSYFFDFNSSDKREETTSTGAMGIGAKSPYAIASQFLVTTYSGTHSQTYLATKNERGIPLCPTQPPELVPCDEPQGVCVTIPIDLEKYPVDNWLADAVNVLGCFGHVGSPYKTQPRIVRAAYETKSSVQEAVDLEGPYGISEEVGQLRPAWYFDNEKLYVWCSETGVSGDYVEYGNTDADLMDLATHINAQNRWAPRGYSSSTVSKRVLLCHRKRSNLDTLLFDRTDSSYGYSEGTNKVEGGSTKSQVFLGNIRYIFNCRIDEDTYGPGWTDALLEDVVDIATPEAVFRSVAPSQAVILLENTMADGSPHPVTWLPSREGLVNYDQHKYLKQLILAEIKLVYEKTLSLLRFLCNGDSRRLETVGPIVTKLSVFSNAKVTSDLVDIMIRELWPYVGTPDTPFDCGVPVNLDAVDVDATSGHIRRLSVGRPIYARIFMPRRCVFEPVNVLIYSRGDALSASIPAHARAGELISVSCERSDRDTVYDYLVNTLKLKKETIHLSKKSKNQSSRTSKDRRAKDVDNKFATCYLYQKHGDSDKVTTYWEANVPHRFTNDNGIANYQSFINSRVDVAKARKLARLSAKAKALDGEVPEATRQIGKHFYVGLAFNSYRTALNVNPRNYQTYPNARINASPRAVCNLATAVTNLHDHLFNSELVIVGVSPQQQKVWDSLELSLLDYGWALFKEFADAVVARYRLEKICKLAEKEQLAIHPFFYTDLCVEQRLRRTSQLRKVVSRYRTEFTESVDPLRLDDLYDLVGGLQTQLENCRSMVTDDYGDPELKDFVNNGNLTTLAPATLWDYETYRADMATLKQAYPLLSHIAGVPIERWLRHGTRDWDLRDAVLGYVQAMDALPASLRPTVSSPSLDVTE